MGTATRLASPKSGRDERGSRAGCPTARRACRITRSRPADRPWDSQSEPLSTARHRIQCNSMVSSVVLLSCRPRRECQVVTRGGTDDGCPYRFVIEWRDVSIVHDVVTMAERYDRIRVCLSRFSTRYRVRVHNLSLARPAGLHTVGNVTRQTLDPLPPSWRPVNPQRLTRLARLRLDLPRSRWPRAGTQRAVRR